MAKIDKLLIANRGEIVIRVIKACRDLDIKTVAVYSDADKDAPHVKAADEAYYIGPSLPPKSYLNIEAIIGVLKESGADAVHPGYGFLAEIAAFAKAVLSEGKTWVGPPPNAMSAIESKCYCRQIANSVEVPVIPGTIKPVESVEEIRSHFRELGGPVFLKLDKGGGGKGIEEIANEAEIETIYDRAKRIGQLAFNSADCYIEKKLETPRHIEVQFLGDNYGNYISLGERECSIQRRHQKIIEESPSPVVSTAEREKLSEWTVKLAKAMGYRSAGTIEFLRAQDGSFYFMEVNARLQVEHPVTEMVTGTDIVKHQLKIASGERLEMKQEDVRLNGHAIEARVYAENPITFCPSPGTIEKLSLPTPSANVRIDHALEEGFVVSPYYDPLLAKIIVWGKSRGEAIAIMKDALRQFVLQGVDTTVSVNEKILNSKEYTEGALSTSFIDDVLFQTAD